MEADLIIKNIGQLVTCASPGGPKRRNALRDVGLIDNGAVAVIDGKFASVGSEDEVFTEFSSENIVDAGGKAVTPGFVDPHTHIVFAGDRLNEFELKIKGADYLDILAAGGGIISTVSNTRAASEDELVELGVRRLDKMLRSGTTSAEIKTGYGLDLGSELKMLRVIERLDLEHTVDVVPTFLAAHTIPPEFKGDPDGYVELICSEMLPAAWNWYSNSRFSAKDIPFFCDVFTEKGAFDRSQTERILGTASSFGYGIKAHVDQFTNLGGSRLAIEKGAASIDHLDAISEAEIELLAASDTIGIVIPTENFSGGKTVFANAREMIDTGCAIAISTDYNPGSAPCPS
ncbi:MAG: imidazolonepropionase, partial [Acidobacteria bacterium]|nr:imidazolonepropionase [Acidobacteriota bacterium]